MCLPYPVMSCLLFSFLCYRELLKDDPDFYVPETIDDLTTSQVLTTEYVEGLPLDRTFELDQDTRNWVCITLGFISTQKDGVFCFVFTSPV